MRKGKYQGVSIEFVDAVCGGLVPIIFEGSWKLVPFQEIEVPLRFEKRMFNRSGALERLVILEETPDMALYQFFADPNVIELTQRCADGTYIDYKREATESPEHAH